MVNDSEKISVSGGSLSIPQRIIPLPAAASPELQQWIIEQAKRMPAILKSLEVIPKTTEEWRTVIAARNELSAKRVAERRKAFPVRVECQTIVGVTTYEVVPEEIPEENRNRVLVHLHGGAYVLGGGASAVSEAILMAHYTKTRVISVDFRLPPDHPFPAALEDSVAVWKEVIKTYKPRNTGLFGSSSGGGLVLAMVHRLKELGFALPAAISAGTPLTDASKKNSDTLYTNKFIDDVLVNTAEGFLKACTELYVGNHDVKDPLVSPVYGDLDGFPPVILTSGTRDLMLSDTVRMHRKLRQAGVEASLQVFEGLSHGEYSLVDNSSESKEAFQEIALFFDKHLGR